MLVFAGVLKVIAILFLWIHSEGGESYIGDFMNMYRNFRSIERTCI